MSRVAFVVYLIFFKHGFSLFTEKNACNSYASYWIIDFSSNCFYNPDVGRNTVSFSYFTRFLLYNLWLKPEILERHTNYYENHTVTTEDGYVLHLFRIPHANRKGVIVLLHPATVDSFVWVGQGNTSAGNFPGGFLARLCWFKAFRVLPVGRGVRNLVAQPTRHLFFRKSQPYESGRLRILEFHVFFWKTQIVSWLQIIISFQLSWNCIIRLFLDDYIYFECY